MASVKPSQSVVTTPSLFPVVLVLIFQSMGQYIGPRYFSQLPGSIKVEGSAANHP